MAALAEGVEVSSDVGCFYLIENRLSELMPYSIGFRRCFARILPLQQAEKMHSDFCPLANFGPRSLLFVDIEATGLSSGSPFFLVGVVFDDGHDILFRQFLERDYSEESALLVYFSEMLDEAEVVVSFNGKSYDLPYIRERSVIHGVTFNLGQYHLDLVYESRRRWRDQFPNCRLRTLERATCHRFRSDDIPEVEIPDAFHRFVRRGYTIQMENIIRYNRLDLIILIQIFMFILEGRKL